jgi:hypothetical protein
LPSFVNLSLIVNWVLDIVIFVTKELISCFDSDSLNNNELYKVKRILDHKVSYRAKKKEYLYKVRWASYRPDNNK